MTAKKLELVNEQTSPLFRIMWVYNYDDPSKRQFGNNISAFHIGNGLILSVAHNLRSEVGAISSMAEEIFQNEIFPKLNPAQVEMMNQYYRQDSSNKKRYLVLNEPGQSKMISDIFRQINFDSRWITLSDRGICKPYLIVQFRNKLFYNDSSLTNLFNEQSFFHEPALKRYTFLISLELVKPFYGEDIALYKIVNTDQQVIDKLPVIKPDYTVLDNHAIDLFCLQSSPGSSLGRLLNNASIEGYSDHWATFNDRTGGNYIMDGLRYLIRGYFRFGSSGAPYVYYSLSGQEFKVNAIQSEASPIQLSINNNREGNYQYVNAIASPLMNIQNELEEFIGINKSLTA